MSLSPEWKKLARQALQIKGSQVPLHRVIDVLAMDDGDISQAVNRYHDIQDADLRRALHYCAVLLREIEKEAGLKPSWEQDSNTKKEKETPSGKESAPDDGERTRKTSSGFSAEELRPFVDGQARGAVQVAKVYVDGASKGNPGNAGIGVAMFGMDGRKIAQVSKAIGVATNNIAEYSALIEALHVARDLQVRTLHVISDSELMVNQVSGRYKVKNPELFKKAQEVMALKKGLEKFSINYVGREHNKLADALSTAQLKKPVQARRERVAEDTNPERDEGSTD